MAYEMDLDGRVSSSFQITDAASMARLSRRYMENICGLMGNRAVNLAWQSTWCAGTQGSIPYGNLGLHPVTWNPDPVEMEGPICGDLRLAWSNISHIKNTYVVSFNVIPVSNPG